MSKNFLRGLVLLLLVPTITGVGIQVIRWFDTAFQVPVAGIIVVNCGVLILGVCLVRAALLVLGFSADPKDEQLWLIVFLLGALTFHFWQADNQIRNYDAFTWQKPVMR